VTLPEFLSLLFVNEIEKLSHSSESIQDKEVGMKHLRKMIAALLDSLAVVLLIGTAAIFAAGQKINPRRPDD